MAILSGVIERGGVVPVLLIDGIGLTKQISHNVRIPILAGAVQRGPPDLPVLTVHVRAAILNQDPHHFQVPVAGGHVERGKPVPRPGVDVGPGLLQQVSRHFRVVAVGRCVECRPLVGPIPPVHVALAPLQQHPNHREVALISGMVEGREATPIPQVDRGVPVREKVLDDVFPPVGTGLVQHRSLVSHQGQGRVSLSFLYQRFHHTQVFFLNRQIQGRLPLSVQQVHCGVALIDEHDGNLLQTFSGGCVQGRLSPDDAVHHVRVGDSSSSTSLSVQQRSHQVRLPLDHRQVQRRPLNLVGRVRVGAMSKEDPHSFHAPSGHCQEERAATARVRSVDQVGVVDV